MTIIEARTQKSTLRLRKTEADVFKVERWDNTDQSWEMLAVNPEYYVAMHQFFDEITMLCPKPRRTASGEIEFLSGDEKK